MLPKKISASFFAIILICFLLPFATVSCNEQTIITLSGANLVTGKSIEIDESLGLPQDTPALEQSPPEKVSPDPRAILALVAAIAGLGSSLAINKRKLAIIPAIAGAFGALMLLLLKSAVQGQVAQQGTQLMGFDLDFGIGFWGAFIFFISGTFLNGWVFFSEVKK